MSRKEAINTFTDGLISDLNPINTPNTVLTDCLNGTLITYDGNEYTLQNDKGNFPLDDCKLPANYIPVGVKEYGDILYIVSYNPITKHVQIGSYPSPETKFNKYDTLGSSTDNNLSYQFTSLWDGVLNFDNSTNYYWENYSTITESLENLKLFYGPPPERYKLNPGDMYKVVINDGANNNPQLLDSLDLGSFEGIEFYIFDENRKPYDITKDIEFNTQEEVYTNWKVPGYMATKLRFAQVDDFKVNVRKIIVPTYHIQDQSAVKELSLNFQYFISDYLYNDHINQTESALKVEIKVYSKLTNTLRGTNICTINDYVDLKNGTMCYYSNWTMLNEGSYIFDSNDTITLEIIPFVEYTVNSQHKKVYYDKFKRTLTFDLSQKGDVNDFAIGEGIWRYTVGNQLVLYFDTSGIQETSVMSQDVELQYKIKRVGSFVDQQAVEGWMGDSNNSNWSTVYDWNVSGDTILRIDLDPWAGSLVENKLYAEDYYYIAFRFVNPEVQTNNLLRGGISKTILATELLNGNDAKRYDELYFEDWISNYSNYIKNKSVNVSAEIESEEQTTFVERSDYYYKWMAPGLIEKYPSFINTVDIDFSTEENPEFTISAGFNFTTNITYTSDLQLPVGPLWSGLTSYINYNDHTRKNIISATGLVDTTGAEAEDEQINKFEKTLRYFLRNNSVVTELFNIDYGETLNIGRASITANGLYETSINHSGGPNPDINVLVNGIQTATWIKKTDSYLNEVSNKLLNMLSSYDVLFLTLTMDKQVEGDDVAHNHANANKNSLRFKTGQEFYTSGDNVYAAASVNEGSTTYFAVFKIKDTTSNKYKLLFVPIGETSMTTPQSPNDLTNRNAIVKNTEQSDSIVYQKLETWSQDIKHVKSDGTIVNGRFVKAIETTQDSRTPSVIITTKPYLTFSQWTFLNKNLLVDSERNTVSNNDNFFKNSPNYTGNPLSTISFDTQTLEISYDGSTDAIDSLLDLEKEKIDDKNTEVSIESNTASSDTYINQYRDDPYIDIFVDESGSNSYQRQLLIKFLNRQQTCDTPIMLVASDYWQPKGEWPNNISYSNSEYSQYNYLGVVEVGIVINPES